jgi:hypothetical protein
VDTSHIRKHTGRILRVPVSYLQDSKSIPHALESRFVGPLQEPAVVVAAGIIALDVLATIQPDPMAQVQEPIHTRCGSLLRRLPVLSPFHFARRWWLSGGGCRCASGLRFWVGFGWAPKTGSPETH